MADENISLVEQAAAVLKEHTRPLLIIADTSGLDGLAGGQGLAQALAQTRQATIVCPKSQNEHLDSLPQQLPMVERIPPTREFIVSVHTNRTALESLRYDVQPDRVDIHLVPKDGIFQSSDISMPTTPFMFDCIVTIGLKHLQDLGPIYHQDREFFFQTPIVNIDRRADNTRFGHVNMVDVTAASISEIVSDIALRVTDNQLDSVSAETLLTGIVSATNGFQSQHLTPRTLTIASQLMASGARREEVVRRLFQRKTVPLLRLWGHALSQLQTADNNQLVWATLTDSELRQHDVTPEQAMTLAHELLTTTPNATFACLLIETPPEVLVVVVPSSTAPHPDLPSELVAHNNHHLSGRLAGTLAVVEKDIIGALRLSLGQ